MAKRAYPGLSNADNLKCENKPKNAGGRPTKYKPKFTEEARKLCLLGATDKDLANFFGVTEKTINNWKESHEEFLQSLKKAKDELDATVVRRLFERATGYEHPEDKIFQYEGRTLIQPTIKHYPPDTTACIFWLKNRQPDKWRDKSEIDVGFKFTDFAKLAAAALVGISNDNANA